MARAYILLSIFLFVYHLNYAQVVNAESLRRVSDTSKWSGYSNLSFDLTKNKNNIFNISNKIHAQYFYKKHLVLGINTIDYKTTNGKNLVNKSTQHLRYNYRFKQRLAWEVFAQSQYDKISAINFRGLIGTGPRFKLSKSDTYRFYTGIISMYEYEDTTELNTTITTTSIRNSSYISFSLFPKKNISIVSTTYYQPRYTLVKDYRISSDTSIALKVFKNLSFSVNFSYVFDAFPALNIPKEQYKLTNGLAYSFN